MKLDRAQDKEHDAWRELFTHVGKLLKVTDKELNNIKYRPLFELVEKWSYYDRLRREALTQEQRDKYPYGMFWKPEEV